VESKEHKVHAYSIQVYIGWALLETPPSSTLVWLRTTLNQRKTPLTRDGQTACSWDSR